MGFDKEGPVNQFPYTSTGKKTVQPPTVNIINRSVQRKFKIFPVTGAETSVLAEKVIFGQAMITPNRLTRNKGLRKWLINTTLVLALLTFSGQVSVFGSSGGEAVRTELNESASVNYNQAACFKKVFDGLNYTPSDTAGPAKDIIWRALQYQSRIKVRSGIYIERPVKPHPTYRLIRYSNDNPDESDPTHRRG